MKPFHRFVIGPPESPYLVRYTLATIFGVSLRLHLFLRPDADACPHDHPWWFWSFVLSGGYIEEIGRDRSRVQWNWPGRLLWRPAAFAHRIDSLPTGRCWTLVLTGAKSRDWGFWSGLGRRFIGWRAFVDESPTTRAAWCASSRP